MHSLSVASLKETFLRYFAQKGHIAIPSASLVPEGSDVLFTAAGMIPLIPHIAGVPHKQGSRLVSIQKVVRTGALDRVGEGSFCTFFELFGNWSLGDYGREEAIRYSWEFLTSDQWLDIPEEHLAVTCLKNNFRDDGEDTHRIWKKLGIPEKRIFDCEMNWKGPYSEYALCGPNTKIFFDTGMPACSPVCDPLCPCGKYVELWDIVFFDYAMMNNHLEMLPHRTVDTGMGVERLAAVIQGKKSVYETDCLARIVEHIQKHCPLNYTDSFEIRKKFHIVADHLRCAVFMMADGVTPSNKRRGYVLRKIIRRAVMSSNALNLKTEDILSTARFIVQMYQAQYPELGKNGNFALEQLYTEIAVYNACLERGIIQFNALLKKTTNFCRRICFISMKHLAFR